MAGESDGERERERTDLAAPNCNQYQTYGCQTSVAAVKPLT